MPSIYRMYTIRLARDVAKENNIIGEALKMPKKGEIFRLEAIDCSDPQGVERYYRELYAVVCKDNESLRRDNAKLRDEFSYCKNFLFGAVIPAEKGQEV